jgi:hypothetical protein
MQTAAAIAKQIGLPEVRVNYRYSEWLKHTFFDCGNPIGKLILDQLGPKTVSERFLQGVQLDTRNIGENIWSVHSAYPEKYMDMQNRTYDSI